MLINRHFIMTLLLAVLWSFTLVAQKGVLVVSEDKNFRNDEISKSRMYFTENKMMIKDKENTIIYDAEEESITNIDHQKKEYMIITKEDMDKIAGKMNKMSSMTSMMEDKLKTLSPQQQEMMRKNMPGFVPEAEEEPKIKYVKVKSGDKVGEWTADKYEYRVDGEKVTNFFISSYQQFDVTKQDFVVMEKMEKFLEEYMSSFSAMGGRSNFQSASMGFDEDSPVFNEGIPIKTVNFKNGKPKDSSIVQKIEKRNFEPKIFEPPSDYKFTTMAERMKESKFDEGNR